MAELAWEFEDPEPVEASHLLRVQCVRCGERTLAAPEKVAGALCGACRPQPSGVVTGAPGPVIGFGTGIGLGPVVVEQPRDSHPRPSVTSRDGVGVPYPSAVMKLAERAAEAGWHVVRQYARGHGIHGGHGGVLAERDSFALIFSGHLLTDMGAYAVYAGGSWKSINIGGRLLGTVTDLQLWLDLGGRVETLWAAHVEALEIHRDYLKAQAKAAGAAPKRTVREHGG